jgi:manganese/iron transport system permease protein
VGPESLHMTAAEAPRWADFVDGWELFREAVQAGAAAGAILGFLSVYIVLRRMVFVSAAVTQAAGLGVALAFFAAIHWGITVDPLFGAMGLSLLTAVLLVADPRRLGISREMMLGAAFAVCGGLAVLVGSRISQEANDIQAILFGTAVVVSREDLVRILWSGLAVLLIQLWTFRGMTFASFDPVAARVQRVPVAVLDVILLVSVGVMVGESARALGALPAFALSTMPGMAAVLISRGPLIVTFAVAALLGAAAAVGGYLLAFFEEFPVGSSQTVVAVGLVVVALVVRGLAGLPRRLMQRPST